MEMMVNQMTQFHILTSCGQQIEERTQNICLLEVVAA